MTLNVIIQYPIENILEKGILFKIYKINMITSLLHFITIGKVLIRIVYGKSCILC